MQSQKIFKVLDRYGQEGVRLLSSATPHRTSATANSWEYKVTHGGGKHVLSFNNTHEVNGVNIAVIIQYGHGTGTGGYVEGIDYINPVIRPLFDKILEDIWRQVKNG
jgi:hypothetical protein